MPSQGGTHPTTFSARADDPRRRGKRHPTDLQSNLGTVIDLSKVGMRVQTKGKPTVKVGQTTVAKIQIPEGHLTLKARPVWIKRSGFRAFLMGVEFIDVSRTHQAALESIAEFGFLGVGGSAPAAGATPSSAAQASAEKQKIKQNLPDYYKILNIGRHSTPEQIRNAFRQLARKYHPDVSSEPNAAEMFNKIHEAYEVLRNENERKSYDLKLAG